MSSKEKSVEKTKNNNLPNDKEIADLIVENKLRVKLKGEDREGKVIDFNKNRIRESKYEIEFDDKTKKKISYKQLEFLNEGQKATIERKVQERQVQKDKEKAEKARREAEAKRKAAEEKARREAEAKRKAAEEKEKATKVAISKLSDDEKEQIKNQLKTKITNVFEEAKSRSDEYKNKNKDRLEESSIKNNIEKIDAIIEKMNTINKSSRTANTEELQSFLNNINNEFRDLNKLLVVNICFNYTTIITIVILLLIVGIILNHANLLDKIPIFKSNKMSYGRRRRGGKRRKKSNIKQN